MSMREPSSCSCPPGENLRELQLLDFSDDLDLDYGVLEDEFLHDHNGARRERLGEEGPAHFVGDEIRLGRGCLVVATSSGLPSQRPIHQGHPDVREIGGVRDERGAEPARERHDQETRVIVWSAPCASGRLAIQGI